MTPTAAPDHRALLAERFHRLAAQWRAETELLSSSSAMTAHPAYRAIISLGPGVVPLLLADLQREPAHWFEALRELTGEDPVPREHWGNVPAMRDDWVAWGRARGLV